MKASVLVTGVTGSGKSTVCKALQTLGYNALDIESIDGLYELIDEKTSRTIPGGLEHLKEGIDWNCSKEKLQKIVDSQSESLTFYCGGMSNTEEVWDIFDSVIILIVGDEATQLRLSARTSGDFGNTQENRDWVLSWKQGVEKRWLAAGGIVVDAEADPSDVAMHVIKSATKNI